MKRDLWQHFARHERELELQSEIVAEVKGVCDKFANDYTNEKFFLSNRKEMDEVVNQQERDEGGA